MNGNDNALPGILIRGCLLTVEAAGPVPDGLHAIQLRVFYTWTLDAPGHPALLAIASGEWIVSGRERAWLSTPAPEPVDLLEPLPEWFTPDSEPIVAGELRVEPAMDLPFPCYFLPGAATLSGRLHSATLHRSPPRIEILVRGFEIPTD